MRMMPPGSRIAPVKLFRSFAKNLHLSKAFGLPGGFMLGLGKDGGANYDLRRRELVIDRVCARCHCEYEWGVHIASYATRASLTDEQNYSTVHGSPNDGCWAEQDRAVLCMADELHDTGTVQNETFHALRLYYEEPEVMELLALAGWYHAIASMANGIRTELEDWAPRFPERRN